MKTTTHGSLALTLFAYVLLNSQYAFAQILFEKSYGAAGGDYGQSVQPTSDGGYVFAGDASSFGGTDGYLVKTDAEGTLQWTKTYGDIDSETFFSLQQTSDGGFIMTGLTYSFGVGQEDFYLVKTDSAGNLQWSKAYGGTSDERAYVVRQTPDGGYIMCGRTFSFGAGGSRDIYLVKTDSTGAMQWSKTYGGTADDWGYFLELTADGGFITGGVTLSFGAGNRDIYLVKTDSTGSVQWSKTFGGTAEDWAWSVQQTDDGGFAVAGYTESFGAGSNDVYLLKTDSAGTLLWEKTYGGVANDGGNYLGITSDGGFIINGFTSSFGAGGDDVYLLKTDPDGALQWANTFGGTADDRGQLNISQTADGGFIIGGATQSFGSGDWDFYLIKTDSMGYSCNESIGASTIEGAGEAAISGGGTEGTGGIETPIISPSPGSGGAETPACSNVGINAMGLQHSINVFPNPFSNQTVLESNIVLHNATLTVVNCFGQTVAHVNNINGNTIVFNRNNLESGLYIVRLTTDNKVIAVDRFVIIDK